MGLLVRGALGALYGWWATAMPPFSAAATVAVVGAGLAAAGRGSRRRAKPTAAVSRGGIAAWMLLVAALTAWQLASFLQHPRADHPTVSSLANDALNSHPARTVAFVVWLAVAAWLARR